MPTTTPLLSVIWRVVYTWAACVLFYFLAVAVTASVVEYLPTSVATTAALGLVAAELFVTGASIVWVYSRSANRLPEMARYVGVAAFAVVQLGTCAIAVVTTLLAMNR